MKCVWKAALCAGALASCAHLGPAPAGPEAVARAYADALSAGHLDDALALSSGLDASRFRSCYSDAQVRERRAAEVRAAANGTAASSAALRLVFDSGAWRGAGAEPAARANVQSQAAAVLGAFLDATDAGDFEGALKLLAPSWRARYSQTRFKEDFAKEPLARERLARARAALQSAAWIVASDGAQLPLGDGKAVRLTREGDSFRLVALEHLSFQGPRSQLCERNRRSR